MKFLFFGKVKEGKLIFENRAKLDAHIKTMEGREVELSIGKRYDTRSNNENRYYWGVIVKILSEHFGYFPDEMHEALKWKFLRKGSDKIPTVQSTARLNTLEFENYLENIRIWASADWQIVIPLPGEINLENGIEMGN